VTPFISLPLLRFEVWIEEEVALTPVATATAREDKGKAAAAALRIAARWMTFVVAARSIVGDARQHAADARVINERAARRNLRRRIEECCT